MAEADPPPAAMDTSDDGDRQALTDRRANRIMKIFGQITECLEDQEVAKIKEIIGNVVRLCRNVREDEKPIQELNGMYVEYLLMVEFRAGISVNLIKQSIRAFLMMEDDIEGLGKKVNDMFLELILIEYPSLAIDMKLTDEELQIYFKLLSEGEEEALHIRLMVVGMYGVGKTSLLRRLRHQDLEGLESTEGVDIFVNTCEIEENGDWKISKPEEREKIFNMRLQKLVKEQQKGRDKVERIDEVEPIPQSPEMTHSPPSNVIPEIEMPPSPQVSQASENTFEVFTRTIGESQGTAYDIAQDFKTRTEDKAVSDLKRLPTLSLWDFAGQSVYYSTHHFFLNDRSIYLLTLDLHIDLNEMVKEENIMELHPNILLGSQTGYTCLDAFKFWIKSIYIYTKQKDHLGSANGNKYTPKIILIGTHRDLITKEQLNGKSYEWYKDRYFDTALGSILSSPIEGLIHHRKFLVNNLDDKDEEFMAIRKEIYNIAQTMPFLEEKIPAKFIPLERAVFRSKNEKLQSMEFEDLREVNAKAEFKLEEEEMKLFLTFQHAFGNVIYYNTDALQDTIILDPQWIINVFKAFVSHKENKEHEKLKKWTNFMKYGILTNELIEELLNQKNFGYMREKIKNYMLHLDVIVQPVAFGIDSHQRDGAADKVAVEQIFLGDSIATLRKENFFIMPCMLPAIPEIGSLKESFKQVPGESHTPTLCMNIHEGFLPPFVFHCMLATLLREKPIYVLQNKKILYNGLGSFSIQPEKSTYLTLWTWQNILHFRISFPDGTQDMEEACRKMRGQLEQLVVKCFNFHHKDTYDAAHISQLLRYRIKCPECDEQCPFETRSEDGEYDYMCQLFSVEDLNLRESNKRKCPCCGRMVNIAEMLKYWFEPNGERRIIIYRRKDEVALPKNALMQTCSIKEHWLLDIASELTWNDRLISELNIVENRVQIINANWKRDKHPVMFRFTILCEWKKRGEVLETLYLAMKNVRMNTDEFLRIIQEKEKDGIQDQVSKFLGQVDIKHIYELEPDERLIEMLTEAISDEFLQIAIRLGISFAKLVKWRIDCATCDRVTSKILGEWMRQGSDIEHLFKAMVKSETNMPEVVEKIKEWCEYKCP